MNATMNAPVKNAPKNAKNAPKAPEASAPLAPLAPQTVEEILANPSGEGVELLVRDGQTGELKVREEGEEGTNVLEGKTVDGKPVDTVAEAIKAANATKEAQEKANKAKKAAQDAKDEANRATAVAKTIIKQASNACKAKLSDKKGAQDALQTEAMRFTGAMAKQAGMKPAELMKEALSWLEETAQDDEETGFSAFFFA